MGFRTGVRFPSGPVKGQIRTQRRVRIYFVYQIHQADEGTKLFKLTVADNADWR